MTQVVIIHGWGADSTSNWFPWLRDTLLEKDIDAIALDFPNTLTPKLSEWLKFFNENIEVTKDTILVGHSLGVPFILRVLEKLPEDKKVKAAYLIAGFERPLRVKVLYNFVDSPFDWKKIKASCEKFVVINSNDDPFVPLEIGELLAERLGVEMLLEKDAGHVMNPDGNFSYTRLLDLILADI